MYIKLGNMTVKQFADAVGADFTDDEMEYLESKRCDLAEFTNPEGFHIFEDPSISINLGQKAYAGRVVETFKAANNRKEFTRKVVFGIETRAAKSEWIEEMTA